MSKALFGAGCFWGPEKKFSEIKGVIETQVGYSQGLTDKTSYEEVCKGNTCLLYTSPSPRDRQKSRMPSSA